MRCDCGPTGPFTWMGATEPGSVDPDCWYHGERGPRGRVRKCSEYVGVIHEWWEGVVIDRATDETLASFGGYDWDEVFQQTNLAVRGFRALESAPAN